MDPSGSAQDGKTGYYTHIKDPAHHWAKRGLNSRTAMLPCGVAGDKDAPLIGLIWVNSGPGDPNRGRHLHKGDAINLILDGAMYMDGVWLRPGQAKIVPAETTYGDGVTSPDGVLFLEIFVSHDGAKPRFHDPLCQSYYEEVHGGVLFSHLGPAGAPGE